MQIILCSPTEKSYQMLKCLKLTRVKKEKSVHLPYIRRAKIYTVFFPTEKQHKNCFQDTSAHNKREVYKKGSFSSTDKLEQ